MKNVLENFIVFFIVVKFFRSFPLETKFKHIERNFWVCSFPISICFYQTTIAAARRHHDGNSFVFRLFTDFQIDSKQKHFYFFNRAMSLTRTSFKSKLFTETEVKMQLADWSKTKFSFMNFKFLLKTIFVRIRPAVIKIWILWVFVFFLLLKIFRILVIVPRFSLFFFVRNKTEHPEKRFCHPEIVERLCNLLFSFFWEYRSSNMRNLFSSAHAILSLTKFRDPSFLHKEIKNMFNSLSNPSRDFSNIFIIQRHPILQSSWPWFCIFPRKLTITIENSSWFGRRDNLPPGKENQLHRVKRF